PPAPQAISPRRPASLRSAAIRVGMGARRLARVSTVQIATAPARAKMASCSSGTRRAPQAATGRARANARAQSRANTGPKPIRSSPVVPRRTASGTGAPSAWSAARLDWVWKIEARSVASSTARMKESAVDGLLGMNRKSWRDNERLWPTRHAQNPPVFYRVLPAPCGDRTAAGLPTAALALQVATVQLQHLLRIQPTGLAQAVAVEAEA